MHNNSQVTGGSPELVPILIIPGLKRVYVYPIIEN